MKIITDNRRARHDYYILEAIEAGIELRGTEVKSLRQGHITLKDSYADVVGGELFLVGAHIEQYAQGNIYNHAPERRRRLLMHKREIIKLASQVQEKGLTLIPLKLYFKDGKVKVEVGLCRGKHTHDKRQTIQDRESKIEVQRALRDANKDKANE